MFNFFSVQFFAMRDSSNGHSTVLLKGISFGVYHKSTDTCHT